MRFLSYHNLNLKHIQADIQQDIQQKIEKIKKYIENDDFYSPDIKKMHHNDFYRAKLDHTHRLLLKFVRYQDETVCLALEVILNHTYDKSRFLRGAVFDEHKINSDAVQTIETISQDAKPIHYLNQHIDTFHILDKIISFDDAQARIYQMSLPLIIIGSAGSGKTALTLEKLRQMRGNILYITRSEYLAKESQSIYTANMYTNSAQTVAFLSYREFLEQIKFTRKKEITFTQFQSWFAHHQHAHRLNGELIDTYLLYEEFQGVITSPVQQILSRAAYLKLGIKQSIFLESERPLIYDLFEKYQSWMNAHQLYDLNSISHEWSAFATPFYDFVLIDEVQDFTNVQLSLVMKCLKQPDHFLLCGDANQVVHPNFFSWQALKLLFWQDETNSTNSTQSSTKKLKTAQSNKVQQQISILRINFRNAQKISELANRVLKIKHARFGSIDKESNFLVETKIAAQGNVFILPDSARIKKELNQKTAHSTQFAVLVLRDEDKIEAAKHFNTPLVFSIHEAKGLEYKNIILYNFISHARQHFSHICEGISEQDLLTDTLTYSRPKNKADKSLARYKFYINALYVALTRATSGVYLVESDIRHPLLALLQVDIQEITPHIHAEQASRDDWAKEAYRLNQQGKIEQARKINNQFLQVKPVPWLVLDTQNFYETVGAAVDTKEVSTKAKKMVYEYALWHRNDSIIYQLASSMKYAPARQLMKSKHTVHSPTNPGQLSAIKDAQDSLKNKYLAPYRKKNIKDVLYQCEHYGIDYRNQFNATPLMMAAKAGNLALVDALLERGANKKAHDHYGHTPIMYAFDEAISNPEFARETLSFLYPKLAYPLHFQTNKKELHLFPHGYAYIVLILMMTRLKTLCITVPTTKNRPILEKLHNGFSVKTILFDVQNFPDNLINQNSKNDAAGLEKFLKIHTPMLWLAITEETYLPTPRLHLQTKNEQGESDLEPLYSYLGLPLLDVTNSFRSQLSYKNKLKHALAQSEIETPTPPDSVT